MWIFLFLMKIYRQRKDQNIMGEEKVTFFFPGFSREYNKESLHLEDHSFFCSWKHLTLRAWIIQTFLRLKELNLNVEISDDWPNSGIVVLLSDKESLHSLNENFSRLNKNILVITIRADEIQWRPFLSDIEIVQNGMFANNRDCFFIPHWPQPGIIKRDKSRKHTIKNIVFKGGRGSLDDVFHSEKWLNELQRRSLNFICHTESTLTNWTDYREADITFAVRPQFGDKLRRSDKPASKLVNSWHAEVPAVLGTEYPFLELKKTEFDYLEAETMEDGLRAIDLLISNEKIYFKMIHNGIQRSQEFSSSNIADQWRKLLFEIAPDYRNEAVFKRSRMFEGDSRKFFNFFTRKQSNFEYKRRLGNFYRQSFLNSI